MTREELWPSLPLSNWRDACHTLHLWTQIAGKIRMTLSPPLNHWWHVALYVNSRGLTTGPIPYPPGFFEIQFDLRRHEVNIQTSEGTAYPGPCARNPSPSSMPANGSAAVPRNRGEINLKPQELPNAYPSTATSSIAL